MATFSDLFARLDPDPRVRGKQFEHVCKWFLTNDPLYKQRLRHVWLWKEWPDRPSDVEAGIDLVAEDNDGHLWAVQAKAYADDRPIPKAELNKFLSESNTKQFSQRLLISTTIGGLHQLAQRAVDAQEKPVTALDLTDLRDADAYLDWPESPDTLRPSRPPKPATPHDYQRDAIRDVVQGFKISDRGQLIMACGTGKTLTSLFIKEKLGAERVMVLVPSLSLLKQTLQVWMANRRSDFDILPVCSDATVSRDEDAIVAHISDLGVPVTTDPGDIARFLRRRGPRVIFSTYQSSPQVAAAFTESRVPAFDLAVADEAHRCAGPVSSDFATVLDATQIKARRRLFMTATPRYFTGRVLRAAKEAEYEYASMDDENSFGPVFHRLPFGTAIERRLLTDYQVSIVGVDDATYREWADRAVLVRIEGNKVTDAATLAGQVGLAKAMRKYGLRRTISFHSRVKRARDFAATLPDVVAWMPARQRPRGKPWCAYTSGEMSAGARGQLIQQLGALGDGEYGLLTNARCLAEGVDVPTLDAVAFIDPRRSEVDIVQAVGRAIRKSDEKKVGTIVIPVFVDTEADPEVALDSSVFKPVWDVIKALRAHDEELGEQLDDLRRAIAKKSGKVKLPRKIHVDLPVNVNADFARAFDVRLVERTTLSWEFWFGLLEQFALQNGHTRVNKSYTAGGYDLGNWVGSQRTKLDRGVLDPARGQRLQTLPGWTWDPYADDWEEGFRQLQSYVGNHGHANVVATYKAHGFRLGAWVNTQRTRRAKGALDPAREERLQTVPGWTWDAIGDQWEEGFSRVLDYVKRNGDARVPANYCIDGYRLGPWVVKQRTNYSKSRLESDREERLRDLPGWAWDAYTAQWEQGFSKLLDYVNCHGDARVPDSYAVDGRNLGKWVNAQRRNRAKGVLESDREQRLRDLPGWTWEPRSDQWEEGFSRLVHYANQFGHARVPTSYTVDDYNLGLWVGNQRGSRARGVLDAVREQRLNGVPGWTWDTIAERWEEGFSRLLDYVNRHGDAVVPDACKVDGFDLGAWVWAQRRNHAKGGLDPDRERRLKALRGWTWNPRSDQWEEGFSRLQDYVERHGDARVPFTYALDGYSLGHWVAKQRREHVKGVLDPDRERQLLRLAGWTWDPRSDRWEEGFRTLQLYVERHGDARVPQSCKVDGYRLGAWVHKQRAKRDKGILLPEQERRLGKLPGWAWRTSST